MSTTEAAPRPLSARLLPFTVPFVLFGVGTAIVVVVSLTEQNLNVYRAKFAARLSLALAGLAFGAFVLGLRHPARWSLWRWSWTFGYLAQVIHFYYAVRAFHFSTHDIYLKQGAVVATSNFVVIAWWGLDVLLAWVGPRHNRAIHAERLVITVLTFVSFFTASVVFRTGFGQYLGIAMTVLVAGCVVYRLLDALAGGTGSVSPQPAAKGEAV